MKKIFYSKLSIVNLLMLFFIIIALQASAQKQSKVAFNGYKGNYIYNLFKPASKEHPDGEVIGFRLDRKELRAANWQTLYQFQTPSSYNELKTNYQIAKNNVFEYNAATSYTVEEVWPIFKRKFNYDSLSVYLTQQPLAIAFNLLLVDSTAKHDQVYQYRVVQINRDGNEGLKYISGQVSASDVFAANRPKKSNRKITGGVFRMEWKAKAKAELPEVLLVKRSDGLKMPFNRILTSYAIEQRGDSVIYTLEDDKVNKDMLYQYTITPVNRFGGGAQASSDTLQVAALDEQLMVPKIFTAKADSIKNNIVLNWSFMKAEYVGLVNVYRSTDYENDYKIITSTNGYNYVDNDVIPGQRYYYYLVVTDRLGRVTEKSIRVYGLVHKLQKSAIPANVNVSSVNKQNVITWSDYNNDTRGFYIYRTGQIDGELKVISPIIYSGKSGSVFSYTDTATHLAGKVGYAVVSENLSNIRSDFSRMVYVVNSIAPTAPTLVDFRIMKEGVYLFWQDTQQPKISTGYNIYKKVGTADYVKINRGTVQGVNTSFKDLFAINDLAVSYKITSVNAEGLESVFSNEIQVVVDQSVYAPTSLKSFINQNKIVLQWQPSQSSVAKYEIYRYVRDASPVKIADVDAKILTYADANFIKEKNNYYFVKTIGVNGKTSLPSSETYAGNLK
jgi:fibronectin type 3 domain-containing protein